eukprot:Clim_evm40s2 gene=Clim_evmTU40s2
MGRKRDKALGLVDALLHRHYGVQSALDSAFDMFWLFFVAWMLILQPLTTGVYLGYESMLTFDDCDRVLRVFSLCNPVYGPGLPRYWDMLSIVERWSAAEFVFAAIIVSGAAALIFDTSHFDSIIIGPVAASYPRKVINTATLLSFAITRNPVSGLVFYLTYSLTLGMWQRYLKGRERHREAEELRREMEESGDDDDGLTGAEKEGIAGSSSSSGVRRRRRHQDDTEETPYQGAAELQAALRLPEMRRDVMKRLQAREYGIITVFIGLYLVQSAARAII